MIHTDSDFASATEALVTELERATDAEIVVVAAARSGRYHDVALGAGSVAALLMLMVQLHSPLAFSAWAIPVELLTVYAFAAWVTHTWTGLLARLVPKSRKDRQAEEAAHALFHTEAVHGTRRRTGVLVYLSALEQCVVVLVDGGVAARVPGGALGAVRWGPDGAHPRGLEDFLGGLRTLGQVLARHLPAEGENQDEIHNAPRVRP